MSKKLFCLLNTLLYFAVSSQEIDIPFYNISEGLSHSQTQKIIQDKDGFIWVATYGGLNRYDGLDFTNYEKEQGLPDNNVTDLEVADDGKLWLATDNGIACYDKQKDSFETIKSDTHPELLSDKILDLEIDNDGIIWIATSRGINYLKDDGTLESIPQTQSTFVKALELTDDGYLWAGTTNDILLLKSGVYIGKATDHVPDWKYNIYTLENDGNGGVWAGTARWKGKPGSGLLHFSRTRDEIKLIKRYTHNRNNNRSIGSDIILSILRDRKNRLWVGTENGGLSLFQEQTDDFFQLKSDPNNRESLSGNSIWNIYEDRSGRLWLSIYNQGINVYDPKHKKFNHEYQQPGLSDGLSNNNISCFHFDNNGEIWIGTDGGGINIWNRERNSFRKLRTDPFDPTSLGSDAVLDIFCDNQNQIWVANWAGGLNKYDRSTNTFEVFLSGDQSINLSSNNVRQIVQDQNGFLWVGTSDGLDKVDLDGNVVYSITGNRLTGGHIVSLIIDSNNAIWVGTYQGLNRISESGDSLLVTRFTHNEQNESSIIGNTVNDIYEDTNRQIWIATKGGISRLLNSKDGFVNYTKSDGLPSSEIRSIFEGPGGNFWIGTTKGLVQMEFQNDEVSFITYDISDGLQGNNFSRASHGISKDGTIYVGGNKGFNYFSEKNLEPNRILPRVVLTDLKIANKSIRYTESESLSSTIQTASEIRLTREQSTFSIAYTGLSYTHPDKNNYYIMLEGFEENWNDVGNQRNATYTNLDPGEYTFMVKAANNDGILNEESTNIKVVVIPAWWETWWFRITTALVLLFIGFWIIRSRSLANKYQKIELERKIKEATEEVVKRNKTLLEQQAALTKTVAETHEVIEKAGNAGDFSARISVENKEGEWLDLANSVNTLLDSIVQPLTIIGRVMKGLSQGDLTQRFESEAAGEILELKEGINQSLKSFSQLLVQVQHTTLEIATASTEMRNSSEEMHTSTTEITNSITEISSGVNNQVTKIDEASNLIEDLKTSASSIDNQAATIKEKSQSGNDISNESLVLIEGLATKADEALEKAEKTTLAIQDLKTKSTAIAEITSIIQEIAGQTNLLSLNASIQAAAAGEAGRGFTVVAEEIRKLADSTKESLEEIEGLIEAVQGGTEKSSVMINEMSEIIKETKRQSNVSIEAFGKLAESNKETFEESVNISEATRTQTENLAQILTQIETVVVIAEQSAAGTDQIAASCEELSSGMTNYNIRTKEVLDKVDNLQKMISYFNV